MNAELAAAVENLNKGAQILDVRSHLEWQQGPQSAGDYIATHIPIDEIQARFQEIDRGQSWVIVCAHGIRANQVCHFLAAQGYTVSNGISLLELDRALQQ